MLWYFFHLPIKEKFGKISILASISKYMMSYYPEGQIFMFDNS